MNRPGNVQTTATESSLQQGPVDQATPHPGHGTEQVTSTRIPLSRTPHPVAQFGDNPGMGTVQSTGTKVNLSRKPSMPYAPTSKTTPEESL